MPFSIMVWLVDPGEQRNQEETMAVSSNRERAPGASSGVNVPPAFTRLVYGLYEGRQHADSALSDIVTLLTQNIPLRVNRGEQIFLIPAQRVHYVVCEEVTRPKDA